MSTFTPDPDLSGANPVVRGAAFDTPGLDRALAAAERDDPLPPKEPLSPGDAVIAAEFQRLRGELAVLTQRVSSLEAAQRRDAPIGDTVDRAELDVALSRMRGAEERCDILQEAKNHWADRARRAEKRSIELEATKNGAYSERNRCVALLARMAAQLGHRVGVGQHPVEDKAWEIDWRTLVFIDLPTGQVSWHFHDSEKALLDGLPSYPGAWDGHTTQEKYRRVAEAGR